MTDLREVTNQKKAETSLSEFIRQGWHVLEPGVKFSKNWHVDAICEHLEAVERDEINRLAINVPPGHMKSLCVSVFYPAWVWTFRPRTRWIAASYSQSLSTRDSVKCRTLIRSEWYQSNWGHVYKMLRYNDTKTEFENNRTGIRTSTSVGGTTTGKRGDRIIVDDPHNVKQSLSEASKAEVKFWWDQVVPTRVNNPKTGKFIIIMQRVHEDDLIGHISKKGNWDNWDHLVLPAQYEKVHPFPIKSSIGFKDPRKTEDELLWPDFYGQKQLDDLKHTLGSYGFAGQAQQRPAPAEGGIIKRAWFRYYRELPRHSLVSWSWDTAIKPDQKNDYSVGTCWALCEDGYYLIDLWRGKVEFPELKRIVQGKNAKYPASEVLIEDKASGQQLLQEFKKIEGINAIAMIPGRDMASTKEERVHIISPVIEAGKVFLPEESPWVQDLIDELCTFPNAAHDDQVDSVSQYLCRRIRKRQQNMAIGAPITTGGSISSVSKAHHAYKHIG